MTLNNKLKIAILTILSSQTLQALTLEPIRVQSGAGNLLYAEIKFSQAKPDSNIEAGLVEAQDLMRLGVTHQSPGHLNFFTRRSGDGTGVIVITSSRPIVDSELNLLLKIREGDATHIHQIRTPLTRSPSKKEIPVDSNSDQVLIPQMIVSEKDIALELPSSESYQPLVLHKTPVPIIPVSAAPALTESHAIAVLPVVKAPIKTTVQTQPVKSGQPAYTTQAVVSDMNKTSSPMSTNTAAPIAAHTPTTTAAQEQPTNVTTEPVEPLTATAVAPTSNSVEQIEAEVQASIIDQNQAKSQNNTNELASQKHPAQEQASTPELPTPKPAAAPTPAVTQVATQKTDVDHKHLVQANESLWKIAARIAAQTNQSIPAVMKKLKENNQHAFINGNIHRIRQGVSINLATAYQPGKYVASNQQKKPKKPNQQQSAKAKYRLNQAEMSLVAENSTTTKPGQKKENLTQSLTTQDLSSKVMTVREKTVKLQKSVSQSTLALRNKDQRIQLLNARLALLQQQLQQQNQVERSVN